jgi:hypothetical protein
VIAIVTELRMNFPPRPFRRPLVGVADALLGDAKPATNALLRGDGASFLSTTSGIAAVSEASAGHAPALGWAGSVQKPQAASAATTEIEREDNGHAEEGASAASRIGPVEPPVPAGDGTAAPGEAEDVQEPRDTSTKAHEEGVSSAEVLRDAMIAQGPRPGSSEPPAPADEQRAAPREAEPEQETRPSLVPANPKADSDVTGPASGHGCWEAPDLGIFQSGEAAQPVWNEFFGGALDEELHSLAEHFGAPGAVPVASFLAIAGGLLGHRLVIDVGPTWRESPMLWTMLIAPSGSKKSSTARVFVPGLRSLEAEEAQGWAERLKEVEEHNLVAGIRKREYLRQLEAAVLAGAELPPAPASELIELPSRKAPQIIIDDVTLPALTTAHAHPWNLSGLIALPDEVGPLFDRLACRSDERTAFLRSHDGGHYRSDRVTRAQIDIESFAVSIVGGAVPGRIALGDVADGFSARALWIAYELEETLPLEDTHFAASVTIEVLRSLRQLARGAKAEPLRLPLSKDARARLALVARGWRARPRGAGTSRVVVCPGTEPCRASRRLAGDLPRLSSRRRARGNRPRVDRSCRDGRRELLRADGAARSRRPGLGRTGEDRSVVADHRDARRGDRRWPSRRQPSPGAPPGRNGTGRRARVSTGLGNARTRRAASRAAARGGRSRAPAGRV